MKRPTLLAAGVLAIGSLAACSQNTRDQTAQAGNSIASDVDATVDNAADRAGPALDRAGEHLSNAGASVEAGADRAGDAIANGADRAADATGNLLVKAGKKLKD